MLKPGISIAQKRQVVEPDCITFLGGSDTLTLSTPAMIAWMEIASRELVKPHLPANCNTVGVHLDIRHLQPVRLGSLVTFHSRLIKVEDRRLFFEVSGEFEGETFGKGAHERFIIDIERFAARVKKGKAG